MTDLSLMLQGGKNVGPAQEFALFVGGIHPHALEQVFESDHFLQTKTGKTVSNWNIGSRLSHHRERPPRGQGQAIFRRLLP